jgi:DNA invertase Pin-like site-specific DNA recombinase
LRRPGIQEALRALEAGEAKALVVAKLDRLSRSMLDFAALMATAQRQSWALVALDCAVDTSTPAGEAMAHVLAAFGQFDRRPTRRNVLFAYVAVGNGFRWLTLPCGASSPTGPASGPILRDDGWVLATSS